MTLRTAPKLLGLAGAAPLLACLPRLASQVLAQDKRPNIIFIMGDDIGWSNIGVYNQGMMAGRTPNLDRPASEGMRFTDFSRDCVEGRAQMPCAHCRGSGPPLAFGL